MEQNKHNPEHEIHRLKEFMAEAWTSRDNHASFVLAPVQIGDTGTWRVVRFELDPLSGPEDVSHLSREYHHRVYPDLQSAYRGIMRFSLPNLADELLEQPGDIQTVRIWDRPDLSHPESDIPIVRVRFHHDGATLEAYTGDPDDLTFLGKFGPTSVHLQLGRSTLRDQCSPFLEGRFTGPGLDAEHYPHFHEWVLEAYRQAALALQPDTFQLLLPDGYAAPIPLSIWEFNGPDYTPTRTGGYDSPIDLLLQVLSRTIGKKPGE